MQQIYAYTRGVTMIKIGALLAVLLLLVSTPLAETYSKKYVTDGWLEVTRTVDVGVKGTCPLVPTGVSDVCANGGSTQPGKAGSTVTRVALTMKNIGPQDRSYVNVGESLSYVPVGADISFSPSPSQFDGRQAVWEIPSLARGESKALSYEFTATVSEAALSRVPDVAAAASPASVSLFAPSRLQTGGTLTLSLKSPEGRPIPGAKILVGYPDGSRQVVRTDSAGTASLVASRNGSYTYSVDGYRLSQLVSTLAEDRPAELAQQPATAASAADAGLVPAVLGALPVLAALFAVAVVALITYNFLAARREDEESTGPAPQLAEQQAQAAQGMNYTQKFTFGTEDEHQQNLDDTTRRMVESRKRRMHEAAPAQPDEHDEARGMAESRRKRVHEAVSAEPEEARGITEETVLGASEFPNEADAERTVSNGDMDREMAELERNARIAGEVAEQEKEVENMLSQLEEIRNRLRGGRGADEEAPEKPTRQQAGSVSQQLKSAKAKAASPRQKKAAPKKRK